MQKKPILSVILTLIIILSLLIWSASFYIHSSELWSIYISKNVFNLDFANTIFLKPLFHFTLSALHMLPLNDVQHLIAAKIIFSLIGVLQVILIIELYRSLFDSKPKLTSISVFLILLLSFSSVNYLQNFFRIRTDQVCATLFLISLYLNSKKKMPLRQHFLFILIYPMIGLKGFIFSILQALRLTTDHQINLIKNKKKAYLYILGFIAFFIWSINFGWDSVLYLAQTTHSFSQYFSALSTWFSSEWILLTISLVSIFSSEFQNFSEAKLKTNISSLSLSAMILILLFPQKHTYFLASFSPLFILNTAAFFLFLYNKYTLKESTQRIIACCAICLLVAKIAVSSFTNPLYRSNFEQLKLIGYISEVLSLNSLTLVDGIGALPKADNLNCFVSPNDQLSNDYCIELIKQGKPDIVILTGRLMGLIGPNEMLDPHYVDTGYNIFIKKGLDYKLPQKQKMQPALFVFGFEI